MQECGSVYPRSAQLKSMPDPTIPVRRRGRKAQNLFREDVCGRCVREESEARPEGGGRLVALIVELVVNSFRGSNEDSRRILRKMSADRLPFARQHLGFFQPAMRF